MSNLLECIANGVKENAITEAQGREASDLFEASYDDLLKTMSPEAAAQAAGRQTFDQLKSDAAHNKRVKLLQIQRYRTLERGFDEFSARPDGTPGKALQALVSTDPRATYSNLENVYNSTRKAAFAEMSSILGRFRKGIVGQTRHRAELPTLIREIFGQDTGNIAAKEMAEAWSIVAENLRKRANAAGMRIPKRADWGMPQTHDMLKVRQVSEQEWKDFIRNKLDTDKMIDEVTGYPISQERLELALSDTYKNITDTGVTIKTPQFGGGGKSLANRRLDHRWLVFKDPDSWLEYQAKFGEPDPFATMIKHVESMSRDIALLEVLGPNPTAMMNALKTKVRNDVKGNKKLEGKIAGDINKFDSMYDIFTGRANVADNQTFADWGAGTRNILNAGLLGGAFLTALSDLSTQRMAAMMVGMPQTKALSRILAEFQPLSIEERGRLALRLGLGADNWIQTAYAQARMFDEVTGPEVTRRISDTVMRVSGLSPWTQAGRQSFGMEFTGYITDNINKGFDKLDDGLQEMMRQNGIGSDKWDIIRSTPLYKDAESGIEVLRFLDIEKRTDLPPGVAREIQTQAMSMVETLTDIAVPVSSTRARATLVGNTRAGSLHGELLRSMAQFKNFPVTIFHQHIHRYMLMDGNMNKSKYMANFLIGGALMGALALQLKDMSKGRDPRPMNTKEFWGAALLQGGSLGIFGDLLFGGVNRMGRGLMGTAAGPSIGMLDDFRNLTTGNAMQLSMGEKGNFASEALRFATRYMPGTSLWYLRLGLERQVYDRLQDWVDPDAAKKYRRKNLMYERVYGQKHWWGPGQRTPDRAPNFDNALGN